MKRAAFSRWFLLPMSLVLLSQCRPGPSRATADPKSQTPPPSMEADAKDPDPKLPPPPMNPPVEAVKKTPPKAPEFQFVSHPALQLKKIGTLTQPVQSLALHPDCKAVAAGAKHWELARIGADGKLAWSTRTTAVPCPAGNRCSEFPRAQFLPNDNIVAMMDGDSLRMFSPKGRMLALRGGFLQAVLDFRASPDGKIVGALYPHGLALWRSTGGLLRKKEFPGATAFDFFYYGNEVKKIVIAYGGKVMEYNLDFSGEFPRFELAEPLIQLLAWNVLSPSGVHLWDKGALNTIPVAPNSRPLSNLHLVYRLLSVRNGKYVIQDGKYSTKVIYDEWELAGVTPGADPVTAANAKCIAIASGNDVYFVALPTPLP